MTEESEKSGKSLAERVRGEKVDLRIEREGAEGHLRDYYLVASYSGGKEREEFFTEMASEGMPFADTDQKKVDSVPQYNAMFKNLMPSDIEPGSMTLGIFIQMLEHLSTRIEDLTGAGVTVKKIGQYVSLKEFKVAYAGLPKEQG